MNKSNPTNYDNDFGILKEEIKNNKKLYNDNDNDNNK